MSKQKTSFGQSDIVRLSDEDAAEMKKAIEEAFETIDPDPGVNFD